jgi:hypothetical protein
MVVVNILKGDVRASGTERHLSCAIGTTCDGFARFFKFEFGL